MTKKSIEEEFKLKPIQKDRSIQGFAHTIKIEKIKDYTQKLERKVFRNDTSKA